MPKRHLKPTFLTSLAIAAGAMLCACSSGDDAIPPGNPVDSKNRELRGFLYHNDAVATKANAEDGVFYWAQQVFSDYRQVATHDFPAQVAPLPLEHCKFRAPTSEEAVHHIHVGGGTQQTPVYAISNKQIAKRAKRFVDSYITYKGKIPARSHFTGPDALGLVNVIVTDTTSPAYLVLTSQNNTVWNIHKAENATISQIAIVGGKISGIANVPDGTPVSAITGRKLKTCRINPARKPQEDWGFMQNLQDTSYGQDTITKNFAYADAYSTWFYNNFGKSSHVEFIGALGVSAALAGPVPQNAKDRVPYSPLEGATLMITEQDHLFITSPDDYRARNLTLVKKAAEKAAGGDLSKLVVGANK